MEIYVGVFFKGKVWNTQLFQQVFTKPELELIPELEPETLFNVPLCKRDQLSSYLKVRRMHHLPNLHHFPNLKAEMNAVNCLEKNTDLFPCWLGS